MVCLSRTLAVALAGIGLVAAAARTQHPRDVTGLAEQIVRLENAHVRVTETRYSPGAGTPRHTHQVPRVVYVLEGGTLELAAPGGAPQRLDIVTGQTLWRPAETHEVRNVGPTPIRLLETEVKDGPAWGRIVTSEPRVVCGWCGARLRGPAERDADTPVSHGMCASCAGATGAFPVEDLFGLTQEQNDALPFGALELDATGVVRRYNRAEERLSGQRREDVIGRNFFRDIAPCTGVQGFEGKFPTSCDVARPAERSSASCSGSRAATATCGLR